VDIPTFRRKHGLSQAGFAQLLTRSGSKATQGLVWQWESGRQRVTDARAVAIEKATGGKVTRGDLRPDLWPNVGALKKSA
jgi:DNA-binding transcriptional regulator YdaS (Cro superfamily)